MLANLKVKRERERDKKERTKKIARDGTIYTFHASIPFQAFSQYKETSLEHDELPSSNISYSRCGSRTDVPSGVNRNGRSRNVCGNFNWNNVSERTTTFQRLRSRWPSI